MINKQSHLLNASRLAFFDGGLRLYVCFVFASM